MSSGEEALDGTPRDALIPQPGDPSQDPKGWFDQTKFHLARMYKHLYDAIMKIRSGEVTLVTPTASANFSPTSNTHLTTKTYVDTLVGDYVPKSLVDAKGDIIAATADDTPARLAVGANATMLTADDGQASGVKWLKPKLDDLDSPDDNTDLDVSVTAHGLCPKRDGIPGHAFLGSGTFGNPDPASHKTSHQSGGADAIKLDDMGSPDDNTDLNASTSAHGLLKKLDNTATNFMNGQGNWSKPGGHIFTPVDGTALGALTIDDSWHDYDASSDTSSSAVAILLSWACDDAASFRNDSGSSDGIEMSGAAACLVVPCSSGVFEYLVSVGATVSTKRIMGYWA